MTDVDTTAPHSDGPDVEVLVGSAKDALRADAFQAQIYKAISVQQPVVLEYLRSLRRDKPEASTAEILRELDRRYVATVTTTSTGVGASAAIPGVGIPIALGLGVADLLFFYETSALYVLAVAELNGMDVQDAARAKPLVFGMLLGEKSQSLVTDVVLAALPGAAGVGVARSKAVESLPNGWGEVLTQQLPDSALAPLLTVLARDAALKVGAKLSAGTLGKAVPFGVGAVIGGVGSFTFGKDVVKAARLAFPVPPQEFPAPLEDFRKPEPASVEPSRAVVALQAAATSVSGFGEEAWDAVNRAADVFRAVDLDGDGVPDEARALTAVKGAGAAVKGAGSALKVAAASASGTVGAAFRRRRRDALPEGTSEDTAEQTS